MVSDSKLLPIIPLIIFSVISRRELRTGFFSLLFLLNGNVSKYLSRSKYDIDLPVAYYVKMHDVSSYGELNFREKKDKNLLSGVFPGFSLI